ncbi:MAG TPA: class II fructose-bisphosphate aldolase [Candidatus Limiplasma sp.]|nr:class II fructose-bisphosphate aldolase [Candidatus Limiplasma sp.]HPS81260.1 class II fructose-bisphosphate aldolase [Candidatus Limiplasma sp.]
MLVNLNEVLLPAKKGKYAVGLFNTVNLEMARGVIAAAEKLRSPVIIGTAEVLLPYGPLHELADLLLPMACRAAVPIVLHYDHGLTFEQCMRALKYGFTSIMYDCSTSAYEDNVRKVRELAEIAHAFGATVEAELGHVGNNEGEGSSETPDPSAFYTEPAQARDFIERTHADALAIAVGTAHGAYKLPPKLDFARIEQIVAVIPATPLVLHGGSGLSDDDFRKAIRCGISKVNIFTDINVAGAMGMQQGLAEGKRAVTDLVPYQVEAIQAATEAKMTLFGSVGKG